MYMKDQSSLWKIIILGVLVIVLIYLISHRAIMFHIPPHIRDILWFVFIISGIILAVHYYKQNTYKFTTGSKHLPVDTPQRSDNELTGLVLDYGANADGDIDNMLVLSGQQKFWLHFPPHTAQQVMNLALKNTTITATIGKHPRHHSDGILIYRLIALRSDNLGKSLYLDEIPPPSPALGRETIVSGNQIEWRYDEHGQVAGFVIKGKIIKLKPHSAEFLKPLLQNAKQIEVKGHERISSNGFVNINGQSFITPTLITIDQTNYVIQ